MNDLETIGLGEKVLAVLELGKFTATYKYALFNAILDLCLEKTSASATPPTVLTTRDLASKVIELYWPHARPYEGGKVLRQVGGSRNQAEILRAIEGFRGGSAGGLESLHRARGADPDGWLRLMSTVEWKLIEMPIPRLQVTGREEDRFLYAYNWDQHVRQRDVSAYQRGDSGAFDNRLLLGRGVAEALVRLNGMLRPIIRQEWATIVAGMNHLPESKLEQFLFGIERSALAPVRGPLGTLQNGRCFYCDERLGREVEVDHFIPWVRYADNGLDNLVVTDARCNNSKRDFLAAAEHVERWARRNSTATSELAKIGATLVWERDARRSRAVARATYSRMVDGAKVWKEQSLLVGLEKPRVQRALERWT